MIPFNKIFITGNELQYIKKAIKNKKLSGNGEFSKNCSLWIEKEFNCKKVLLTPSCSASLEMASILIDIKPKDEIIMPSFTFVSTANPFVLRGAKIVFVDIHPKTMNIDESKIEDAITKKTKAIVPVHYAGFSCNMDKILKLAKKYNIYVIEDAAHGIMATYKKKYLGTIGDIGCYSFHESKNYSSGGEGGAILINKDNFIERSKIIQEKGTDRKECISGKIDKYTWKDFGSNYLMSDLQAAYLFAQLNMAYKINKKRLKIWKKYYDDLRNLEKLNFLELPYIPKNTKHNAHIFYIKLKDKKQRDLFNLFMNKEKILTSTHYIPLHSTISGSKFGRFHGMDLHTTKESDKLVRLPMFYDLTTEEQNKIIKKIKEFFL